MGKHFDVQLHVLSALTVKTLTHIVFVEYHVIIVTNSWFPRNVVIDIHDCDRTLSVQQKPNFQVSMLNSRL
jgi:hypothetical protein